MQGQIDLDADPIGRLRIVHQPVRHVLIGGAVQILAAKQLVDIVEPYFPACLVGDHLHRAAEFNLPAARQDHLQCWPR